MFEARLSEGEAGTWMGVRDGEELTEYPLELRDTELGRPRGRGDRVCNCKISLLRIHRDC